MSNRSRQRPRTSRRFVAVFATLALFGALVAVTQSSLANSRGGGDAATCRTGGGAGAGTSTSSPTAAADAAEAAGADAAEAAEAAGADATQHDHGDAADPAAQPAAEAASTGSATTTTTTNTGDRRRCRPTTGATETTGPPATTPPAGGNTSPPPPLQVIGTDCSDSGLAPHDGFQLGSRCVSTAFGEVGEAAANPTLLISRAPLRVRANTAFTIQVSTRNLVRDRFLPAKDGGYYRESAYLNDDGIVRGHFHTACRMLTGRQAPDPAPVPVFFAATEDGKGSTEPDTVTVNVAGLPSTGLAQCAAWAGDGSHRVPMMQRANQIPAFDSVRILVTR